MMQKIIVSLLASVILFGCATKPETKKDQAIGIISSEKIAECTVKVDATLPDKLDLTENKLDTLVVVDNSVTMTKQEFLSIQNVLLKLKNRIYELQEIIKDTKK